MRDFRDPESGKKLKLTKLQRRFLSAYAKCGVISMAAAACDMCRSSHYYAMRISDDYAKAFGLAHADACDVLEAEARKRAVEGWDEPVFYEGAKCGDKRKYSDSLMALLLKGAMPDKYGTDRVKQEVTSSEPVQFYLPENGR